MSESGPQTMTRKAAVIASMENRFSASVKHAATAKETIGRHARYWKWSATNENLNGKTFTNPSAGPMVSPNISSAANGARDQRRADHSSASSASIPAG